MIENGLNKKAIIGKHLGEPLCLWTACGCHVDTAGGGGAVVGGGEEKGETEREKKRYRDWKVGGGGERAAQLPLQSKWSILSFPPRAHGCPRRWWWLCRRRAHRPLLWPRLSSTFLRKRKNKLISRKTNTEQPCMVFAARGGEKHTSEGNIGNAT